jgi:hypothetical protein
VLQGIEVLTDPSSFNLMHTQVSLQVPRMAERLSAMAYMRSLKPAVADLEVGAQDCDRSCQVSGN